VENARKFESFLEERDRKGLDSTKEDLDLFNESVLGGKNVARFMWTLQYYFLFINHDELLKYTQEVREGHTAKSRRSFRLKEFKDVNQKAVEKLSAIGIDSVDDILKVGKTKSDRDKIAKKSGVKIEEILELVKLSNLTRLGAVKSVRARLYYESGFDSIEKISKVTSEELIRVTKEFIKKTGFEGIPPTPKEADNTVKTARKMKDIFEL
jgi:replicative superfamily II helicase